MTESAGSRRLKTRVRVRLPTDLYDALVVIARVRGESLDATVRRAASEYVASARQAATPETPQVWGAMLAAAPQQPAGPGWRLFAADVLGNPMREYAPGKWEYAQWPSQQPAAPSGEAVGSDDRRERLLERRNVLNNSFGNGAYQDGRVQQQIDAIDAELAALAAPQQPAGVGEAAAVLADLHPFLFGLKLAAPNEEKRAFIQERIDAVRRASAALATQQQGGA